MGFAVRPPGDLVTQHIAGQARSLDRSERMPSGQHSIGPQHLSVIPACRVFRSSAQSLANTTANALSFDGEVFDTAGLHDAASNPHRLTAPIDGLYMVGCHVAVAAGTGRECWGQINAIDISSNRFVASAPEGGGSEWRPMMSAVVKLAAGDWVAFSVYHSTGAAINANYYGTVLRPEAWMAWIGNAS